MIRSKNLNPLDGASFGPTDRPPVDQLSPEFVTLFAEYDELKGNLGRTESELRNLNTSWSAHAEIARKADGRATAESGRSGTGVVITESMDALHEKRRELEDRAAALREAVPIIEDDLAAERTRMQGNIAPYVKAEDKARTVLAKALDDAEAAARALTVAIATREWITNHTPWEGDALLDIKTVWEPASRLLIEQQTKIPVRVSQVINALKGL